MEPPARQSFAFSTKSFSKKSPSRIIYAICLIINTLHYGIMRGMENLPNTFSLVQTNISRVRFPTRALGRVGANDRNRQSSPLAIPFEQLVKTSPGFAPTIQKKPVSKRNQLTKRKCKHDQPNPSTIRSSLDL